MGEIRTSRESDMPQLKKIWSICFSPDSQAYLDWFFTHKYQPDRTVVLEQDGELLACGYLVDYHLCFCQTVLFAPYIVGVATLPQHRNKGYAAAIMQTLLQMLEHEHTPLTVLYPFRHAFYKKFGFITYTFLKEIKPLKPAETETVPFDFSLLKQHYNQYAKGFDSFVLRDDFYFSRLLDEHRSDGGVIHLNRYGYCLKHGNTVDELVAQPGKEKKLMASLGVSAAAVHVPQRKHAQEGNMVRITDLKTFMKAFRAEETADFKIVIKINDAFCAGNNGCFELRFEHGTAKIKDTDQAPELTVSVLELTRFLFGLASLENDFSGKLNKLFRPMVHLGFDKC